MANAAPKLTPFDFTLDSDKDALRPTVFRLRPLSAFEYIEAGEIMSTGSRGEFFKFVLQTALLGWSHFADDTTDSVDFSRKQSENLERLTVAQVQALAGRILEASSIDETERKN